MLFSLLLSLPLALAPTGDRAAGTPAAAPAPIPLTPPRTPAAGAAAEPLPDGLSEDARRHADRGWDLVYDLDYVSAILSFKNAQKLAPHDPRTYFGEAVAVWLQELERKQDLEVSRFVDSSHFADENTRPTDPVAESRFNALLDRATAISGARLAKAPDDIEALYLLGSAAGVRASFEATVNHDTRGALSHAKEAWRLEKAVVAREPRYYDAYFTLGVYEYITGSLPFYVKWIAALAGFRGSKPEGIQKIEAAAEHGRTAARDAKVILTVIYARERRYTEAVALLRELAAQAPHNHVLRLNTAYCLMQMGRYPEAAESYAEALRVARPEARLSREGVRFLEARARLYGAEQERAIALAEELLAEPALEPALATRARLVLAQALDASGRREEALRLWQELAREKSVDHSRSTAKKALKKPWSIPASAPPLAR